MSDVHPSEAEGRAPTILLGCPYCDFVCHDFPTLTAHVQPACAARSPAPSDGYLSPELEREYQSIVASHYEDIPPAAPSVEARDADDLLNRFHSVCDGLREYAESGYPKNAQARYDAVRAELRALLPPETL